MGFDPLNDRPLTTLMEGLASPSAADYLAAGGYGASLTAARQGGRNVIRILRDADVRSRDGAGTPLFMTWRAAQSAPAPLKYVVCLGDDPDAGAGVWRKLLDTCPHAVLEGMICGGLAVGATTGIIYLRENDYDLAARLERAVAEAHAEGFLGEDALLDIHIVTGGRAFLCGAEAPQITYLEEVLSNRAPVERGVTGGLFGWPTVMHDPETWCQVPLVLAQGPQWYRSLGRDGLSGTKLVHLAGPLAEPGLHEVPLGISIADIFSGPGGGLTDSPRIKAVQMGGPSGGFLPAEMLELALDYEILAEVGLSMGSGGMEILDDSICLVARTLELASGCIGDSCDQVIDCDRRLNRIKRLLREIEENRGTASHLFSLERVGVELLGHEVMGSGRSVARPLLTSLAYFRHDYDHHLSTGVCATGKRYGLDTAPCQAACPAGIDVPSYLALIGEGKYTEAVALIRQDNPLAWTCGLVCTHPCEAVCTRSEMDEPISIMCLKGFAADQIMENGGYPRPPMEVPKDEKVAVIGAGPAGLSAAYFLTLRGYPVTIFEALPLAGGVLSVGIPEYRLPAKVVAAEVQAILDLGVELKTGVRIGRDVTIDELREQGYKAFFAGLGAPIGMNLGIDGERELLHVYDAMSYLSQVRMGRQMRPADEVIVVGGGNAAIDAARTCVRLGCKRVVIAYRRTRREMPAWEAEVRQAEEEGVELNFLTIPKRVVGEGGRVAGLEILHAELGEPDASGRRRPVPRQGSEQIIRAGAVIAAIGQSPRLKCLSRHESITVSDRGRMVVNPDTLQTTVPDIFAGGDVVTGPATVVQAVAAGKWAARSIDAFLSGEEIPKGPPAKRPRARLETKDMVASERVGRHRVEMPLIPMEERRNTFKWVEAGLSEEQAQAETARCLRCDLCVGCGLCQMVCEEMGIRGLQMATTSDGRLALTDYHRPARRCIGCGSCVQACPHKNIRMLDSGDERRIVFCGTETAKLKMEHCESCGKLLAPEAYMAFLNRLVEEEPADMGTRNLCPECARKRWAEGQAGDVLWFPPPDG